MYSDGSNSDGSSDQEDAGRDKKALKRSGGKSAEKKKKHDKHKKHKKSKKHKKHRHQSDDDSEGKSDDESVSTENRKRPQQPSPERYTGKEAKGDRGLQRGRDPPQEHPRQDREERLLKLDGPSSRWDSPGVGEGRQVHTGANHDHSKSTMLLGSTKGGGALTGETITMANIIPAVDREGPKNIPAVETTGVNGVIRLRISPTVGSSSNNVDVNGRTQATSGTNVSIEATIETSSGTNAQTENPTQRRIGIGGVRHRTIEAVESGMRIESGNGVGKPRGVTVGQWSHNTAGNQSEPGSSGNRRGRERSPMGRGQRRPPFRPEQENEEEQFEWGGGRREADSNRPGQTRQPHVPRMIKAEELAVKKEEPGSDSEPAEPPKQKPNFALSGKLTEETNKVNGTVIAYAEPPGARKPKRRWRLYPFKGEQTLPTLYIHRQSCYLIGRDRKVCDLPVDHPSCSKQHAVLQYRLVPYQKDDGSTSQRVRPYIIDLESANGTFVNNKKIEPKRYVELLEKDVLKFGFSSREYVLLHENSKEDNEDDDGYEVSPTSKPFAGANSNVGPN
uniref:FHA domain-containing protein n=1 Tax=Anopheles atroparvus TaxID=41427 RepID=A0A182IP35_ANOAO